MNLPPTGRQLLDQRWDALRLLVERLCQCSAKLVTVEPVTLADVGQAREIAVFALDGHPEKAETAYAWSDFIEDCDHHRVVMGTGAAASAEAAVRSFFGLYGAAPSGIWVHRPE